MRRRLYDESDMVGGGFVVEAEYHSLALLLEWAMGGSTTSGAGPYAHAQVLASEIPFGMSLDVVRGEGGTSDKVEGCMPLSWSLSVSAASAPMRFACSVLGQTGAIRTSISTPSFSTLDLPVLYHQAGDFTWNSVGYKLIDYTLNVDNALGPRIRLGSLNTLQPKRVGHMSVTSTITLEVEDALVTAHLAGTQSDYSLDFDGPSTYALNIDGHNCIVTSISDPVQSAGILTQTVTLTHLSDGTDDGLAIEVVNSSSDNRTVAAS
jgi:hypothetical protein